MRTIFISSTSTNNSQQQHINRFSHSSQHPNFSFSHAAPLLHPSVFSIVLENMSSRFLTLLLLAAVFSTGALGFLRRPLVATEPSASPTESAVAATVSPTEPAVAATASPTEPAVAATKALPKNPWWCLGGFLCCYCHAVHVDGCCW